MTRHKELTQSSKARKTNRKRTRAAETINMLNTQTFDPAVPLLGSYTISILAHIHKDRSSKIAKIETIRCSLQHRL